MDFDEYRQRGKEMVDYIADYLENIRERRVFPNVKPGYMRNLIPDSAPVDGEDWDKIFNDIERVIMPGVTHWQSPHMHAYFPALNSFPSLLGDMLADAINGLGFTWASSPACTELETIVMNWLGKMIGLPDDFLHTSGSSKGGGVIQTTASEATLVGLLAGRTVAIKRYHEKTPGFQDAEINARLVAYCSDQAHSSVEKAALIGLVRMRYIESDENLSQRGAQLAEAIENDIREGLIPFWVCATLGTTGACAFDNLDEIGDICRKYKLWLHVDAAYAGSAFICPEYRVWLKGIEKVDSIAFNPSKWLMVHFDCTAMWVRDSTAVHRTFNVEPLYLQHENSGHAIDYMHWQIPLSKRFRAVKLWFVLRSFGIKGLQKHIREGVRLAQKFEALVLADHRFEIPAVRHLGMVVFRIKGDNNLTERLLKRLNQRGYLHCVPASLKGKYVIRFTITSTHTTNEDLLSDWAEIRQVTTEILKEMNISINERAKVSLKDIREKNDTFGSSLLLANTPMSPKIVNGSFAAIFDAGDFLEKAYAGIRQNCQDSPAMRRRVRGILMSGKQFSLDSRMDLVAHHCLDSCAKNGDKAAAINEDSEDLWEAYENLGTPPLTPSPLISPLTPSLPSWYRATKAHLPSKYLTPKPVRSQTVKSAQDLTRSKITPNYRIAGSSRNLIIDNVLTIHEMETNLNIHKYSSSQTVHKTLSSNSFPAIHHERPSVVENKEGASQKTNRVGSLAARRRAFRQKEDDEHAFYNKTFREQFDRKSFQCHVFAAATMPNIAEHGFEDEVDWDAVKRSFDENAPKKMPKVRIQIVNETGEKIGGLCDTSSDELGKRENQENIAWTSLDCADIDDAPKKWCEKCGHHRKLKKC